MVLDNSTLSIQPTTIDQVTQWQSVELKNNSKVTHADSADISLGLNWQADTITVDATSSFDVSSKSSSHNGIYSGGSHAGRGAGVDSDLSYGSIDQPYTMGKAAFYSGSTYKKGGGAIRLVANELVLNGTLISDGEGYSSYNAGAGGSIWVVAETLSGIGSIHASGAGSTSSRYPGAGGRVAVYANDTSNFDLSKVEAKGGLNTNYPTNPTYAGGAGTVYLKNTSTNKTDLVLSSQLQSTYATPILSITEFDDVTIQNAYVQVDGDVTQNKTWLIESSKLSVTGNYQNQNGAWGINNSEITVNGEFNNQAGALELTGSTLTLNSGLIVNSVPLILDNSIFSVIPSSIDQVIQWQSVELKNNSKVTHADSVDINLGLNWQADTIFVDATSSFDVSGKSQTYGTMYAGGSNGGRGGYSTASSEAYGSLEQPFTMGLGGIYSADKGDGGGAIHLTAQTLTLNGSILSNGVKKDTSGAGGSLWLNIDTLVGSGSISASGGNTLSSYSSGGGGRIAVYANDTSNFDLSNVEAKGGLNTNYPTNPTYAGGAGTVYLKNTSTNKTDLVLSSQLH
jgi:hypothetical protein